MTALAQVGGPLGAAGLALVIAAPRRDLRLAGVLALALGGLALVPLLAPDGQEALLAAGAVAGAVLLVPVALVLRRWPWLLPPAALALVPARVPVEIGGTDANLLLPLYGLVGAAAALLAWELARGDARVRELGPLALPLAALVSWFGLSLAWSDDVREGAVTLAFFVLPFGLLAVTLARLEWTRQTVQRLYAALAVLALVFAAIGLYQWATRDVFWNPKVIVANAYQPELFYRVNSVFWDPSIYGRFLVVALLATLVLVLFGARGRVLAATAAGTAVVWLGLFVSFSQSSFVALVAGTTVAALVLWGRRAAGALGAATLVGIVVVLATPQLRESLVDETPRGLDDATSGRWGQVSEGLRIARDNPVVGVGLGGFKQVFAERTGLRGEEPASAASHNTPVTVAAETGLPGLLLLVWLAAAALVACFRRAGPSLEGRVALAAGACLTAIGVHSLFYNALFEDPTTWGLLALAAVVGGAELADARRGRDRRGCRRAGENTCL